MGHAGDDLAVECIPYHKRVWTDCRRIDDLRQAEFWNILYTFGPS